MVRNLTLSNSRSLSSHSISRLYDKRVPIEAQYPSLRPSNAQQYVRDGREGKERQDLLHAPPG